MDKFRVVMTDDHVIMREGTGELVQREPNMEVVGEAGDGEEAVELRPDAMGDYLATRL